MNVRLRPDIHQLMNFSPVGMSEQRCLGRKLLRFLIKGTKYHVGDHIGRGGFADVYLGRSDDGKTVALKIFGVFDPSDAGVMSDKIAGEAQY
jgi:serine/threonine protein kinase